MHETFNIFLDMIQTLLKRSKNHKLKIFKSLYCTYKSYTLFNCLLFMYLFSLIRYKDSFYSKFIRLHTGILKF